MLLSFNWLRDYLQKPDIKFDAKELAEKLTMRGVQVAAIRRPSLGLDNVVVGKIIRIEPHPNADRLQVTQVVTSDDPEAEKRQIVCGAKNIAEGDIVPIALPGATLPGDFTIKESKIRGVESLGMICSAKELGVSDDTEGILQLPKHSVLGEAVSRLLGGNQNDTIFELELTANRPDCMSMMGLARELCPLLKTKVRDPKPARFRVTPHRTSSIVKVEVDDPSVCPRYVARVIDHLKVEESPQWIKDRLESVGIRSINNIVDITNFVMYEYGQPLHAFDLRKIQSGSLRVAACNIQTEMTLLNGQTVTILPGDIVIWDGDRPAALAGIMGGANSQVEADTTSILLESAAFNPQQIRRTAKRLGLITDASKRFEKGSDLAAVAVASERAAALLRDTANANVYHPPIDTNEFGVREHVLAVDMRDVRRILGLKNLSSETVADLLESIGIASHKRSVNILSVRLPSFRPDLKEAIDIVEEVARLYGYDGIPSNLPVSVSAYDQFDESLIDFELKAKNVLVELGMRETIHYSFVSEDLLRKFGVMDDHAVILKNPISEEMRVMRTSLIPSLATSYLYNKNRRIRDQKIFEVGRTYRKDAGEETTVKETTWAAGLIAGNLSAVSWRRAEQPVDFFSAKGIVESLIRRLTTVLPTYEPVKGSKIFHPMRGAVVRLGHKEIGTLGELHPLLQRNFFDAKEPVVVFEINLEALRRFERSNIRYRVPSKFPGVEVDFAFVVDKAIPGIAVADAIRQNSNQLLADLTLFDVYEGEHVPEGKKSLAYRITLVAADRTLQDEEIGTIREKIVSAVNAKTGGQLRT